MVAVNKFFDDSREELDAIVKHCAERGIPCAIADIFSQGGEGGKDLAQMVVEAADRSSAPFKPLYESALPVEEKLNIIARNIYGADGVELTAAAKKKLAQFEASRLTDLPICMAKPRTPFPTTDASEDVPPASPSPCATLKSPTGPASWWPSAGKSCACPPFPSHRTPCTSTWITRATSRGSEKYHQPRRTP